MTHLTERQAWVEMGLNYSARWDSLTPEQQILAVDGCCPAIDILFDWRVITNTTRINMLAKIVQCLPVGADIGLDYFEPRPAPSTEANHLRADFCYLMAYACEEE